MRLETGAVRLPRVYLSPRLRGSTLGYTPTRPGPLPDGAIIKRTSRDFSGFYARSTCLPTPLSIDHGKRRYKIGTGGGGATRRESNRYVAPGRHASRRAGIPVDGHPDASAGRVGVRRHGRVPLATGRAGGCTCFCIVSSQLVESPAFRWGVLVRVGLGLLEIDRRRQPPPD